MFLRELRVRKEGKEYTYLKVVENVRHNGRPVQRTLLNLGNVTHWPPERRRQLAGVLARFLGAPLDAVPGGLDLADVRLGECRQLGPYLPLSHLWEKAGLDDVLRGVWAGNARLGRMLGCAKAMVLTRLVAPCSKLAVWQMLGRDAHIPGVEADALPLHAYYRTLSALSQSQLEVERGLYAHMASLFNRDVSQVFWDMTSAYLEGTHCPKARYGYSREHRPDLVQIEIGLLVDAEGIPIGHQVFEGNVKDVATVLTALQRLKQTFEVHRCIFVGDDGMASKANLAEIEKQGYEYITSLSLGHSTLGEVMLRAAPPPRRWPVLSENLALLPLRRQGRVRYLGLYNPQRAASTRWHRRGHLREGVAFLRQLRAGPKPHGRRKTPQQLMAAAEGYLRRKGVRDLFRVASTPAGGLEWSLDREALRRVRRRDGVLVVVSNSQTLNDREVAQGYRSLWRVEDAFRNLKDVIGLRPIRHWNDARVLGHVFVCVLAYTLQCLYERDLRAAGLAMSARRALQELGNVTVATLEAGGRQIRRRSELSVLQRRLLAAAGVEHVPEIW